MQHCCLLVAQCVRGVSVGYRQHVCRCSQYYVYTALIHAVWLQVVRVQCKLSDFISELVSDALGSWPCSSD